MTADQPALFGAAEVDHAAGPVELATRRALAAAGLEPTDEGAGAALCALAWALDAARAAGKFYGVAQAGPPYLDLARALGLTVDARPAPEDDSWAATMRKLTEAV